MRAIGASSQYWAVDPWRALTLEGWSRFARCVGSGGEARRSRSAALHRSHSPYDYEGGQLCNMPPLR